MVLFTVFSPTMEDVDFMSTKTEAWWPRLSNFWKTFLLGLAIILIGAVFMYCLLVSTANLNSLIIRNHVSTHNVVHLYDNPTR